MTSRADGAAEPARSMPADEEIEAEFDLMTGRLGLHVPADLKAGVIHGYRRLRDLTMVLRREERGTADSQGAEGSGG